MIPTRFAPLASRLASSVRRVSSLRFLEKEVQCPDKLFINNEWRAAQKTFAVTNPANGEELFHCAKANVEDVDVAVRGARECFESKEWKAMSGKERGAILRRMAALLREQKEDFAMLETLDNGKPINESRADIDVCIGTIDFYAGMAENFDATRTKIVESSDPDFKIKEVRLPIGVVGAITPWNFPLMQSIPKIVAATAAGCTTVIKPSSVCSATTLKFGEICLAAGLPAGALNIITGSGREAGQAMLDHPGFNYLSFTGSSAIGHEVLHASAKQLSPSLVELGGKGAIVVFDDVDIEVAVDWVMVGIFVCGGQTCSATSRLLVHEKIEAKLMARLVEETNKIKVGDPRQESTQLGSLTSNGHRDDVHGFVTRAVEGGAELVCGGKPVAGDGAFYPATIIRNLADDSEAWVEEIFGPVLAVRSFSTEEEAVRIANASEYGLGNAVLTADAERCERVAQQLHAGIVWKNCTNAITAESSFGGFKKSGFGKEYGTLGLEEYIQTKVIVGCEADFSWDYYVPRKK